MFTNSDKREFAHTLATITMFVAGVLTLGALSCLMVADPLAASIFAAIIVAALFTALWMTGRVQS